MSTDPEYATVRVAAALTGIPARTIRYWVTRGKLPAVAAPGGSMVALSDVRRLGALGRQPRGNAAVAGNAATATTTDVAVEATGRAQLEAIRDEWLQPLVDQIREQAQTIGRLAAERDQAVADRDALRASLVTQPQPAQPSWLAVLTSRELWIAVAAATVGGFVVSGPPVYLVALVASATDLVSVEPLLAASVGAAIASVLVAMTSLVLSVRRLHRVGLGGTFSPRGDLQVRAIPADQLPGVVDDLTEQAREKHT
jgi:hypothetical protein